MVKVLKILGWLFAAIMGSIALLVGVLWATGQFKQTTVELDSIVFDELVYDDDTVVRIPNFGGIEDKTVVLDDFSSSISFTPENATNKTLRLQVNKGASLVKVPERVTAGEPFKIEIVKDENGVSLGGEVEISAFDTRGLTATSTPLSFFIDQPIHTLTTSLDSVYQYTNNTLDFSISSSPINALNPTKEPNKYTNASGNVTSAKQVKIEVYDVRPSNLQVITNLTQGNNVVDLIHNNVESRWQFGVGRDGKTIFVFKAFDTYKLAHDYELLQVTKDNFDDKIEQVNAFLNKYIEHIRSFQFDYDVSSMTSDQVTIGNRYKIVRTINTQLSSQEQTVYDYDYQIVTNNGQAFSGQAFIDTVKLAEYEEDIIGNVRNYETFLDAMEYLYVISTKQVSVVNAEAADLICNERLTLDVHEKRSYQTSELREQLGVKIVPNETSANLDNRIVDVKAFGARLIDGTYYLEDYDVASNQSQVQQIVNLLNSDKNVSNKQGHVFDVLKINNKAQDATIVVDNPKTDAIWHIAAYNKLQNVKEKTFIVFTYYHEGSLDEESDEKQELIYYALMEVQIEQQEVEALRFNYDQSTRYNHVILSTEHNGTRIGNVTFSHALTLPNDLASIYHSGDKEPTYTTIKYFALADTVMNNGKFVIKVDQSKIYHFDGMDYYEITSRDVASGNVRIEALNASLYENERYLPVEVYAYVVKTDINGNIIYQDGSYVPVSSRSNNRMEYIVRPFINNIYVYTNFNGEYLLRNNESEAYTGLYDVDGEVYNDENRALEQANILGTTVKTIIKADRNIKVLIDQEFDVIVTNKILKSDGTDYRTIDNGEDYAFNYCRALEDTNLLYHIASYMWFQADGKEYDLEGYLKGTNPSTNPEVTQPEKYQGEIPFALLSSEYDQARGVIVVKLKANTSLSDQYLDISYRRIVEEVDDSNGDALKDSITIDARMQIQGHYLELGEHTSILAGYGADHYQGEAKQSLIWADHPYMIPVSGKVAGRLESWQVTNYATLSETFRHTYADNYYATEGDGQKVSIDDQGTVGGNYPFSLKALQFNYELQLPEILEEQGITIDTYPDLVVDYTPYLATKVENNGVVTYQKGLPATDYIRLTQYPMQQNFATITFLKAPTTAIDIIFECDIYLYETSKTTEHVFQNKFYLKHFQFTSQDTVMSLVQQDPMFDLLQFDEQGLVITNGKPVSNTRQSQSILKGGTEYNLNGVNGAVRVGFSVEDNNPDRVKADSEVFSACTFTIDSDCEDWIYFNLDGKRVQSVRADGTEIKELSIGAYSTNVRREASFTVQLLGISVTYYVTVDSNIQILFNENADGNDTNFVSYEDTKTINASADQVIRLDEYFKIQGTRDTASETYQPVFYMKLGQDTSNYFILENNQLQVGRAYQDKEIVLGIDYVIKNGNNEEYYTTTSQVKVNLVGVPVIEGVEGHPFNEEHNMHLTLANGTTLDLSEYVTGVAEGATYKLTIDDSKLDPNVVLALFGNNVTGAINGWELGSESYYEIVKDIPVRIKYIEKVKNGNQFTQVEQDTGYAFYLTLQPEVAFDGVDSQVITDQSSPQNPSAFGSLPLYDKEGDKVVKLIANGTNEVLYYGYESAELLQDNVRYLGDVLTILEVWNEDHTELLALNLHQNRSVAHDTTFTLRVYTKYGKTLDIDVLVKCNYIATINYPFHGSKTGSGSREEIRVGTTIDLLDAYVNKLPRINVFNSDTIVRSNASVIKNIQAYAGSTNVTSQFTIQGSTLTLKNFTAQNNYVTLQIELFNGLLVEYELEVIVAEASTISVNGNADNYDSNTNTLTIFGQQKFNLRDYFTSASSYFGVFREDSNKDSLLKVNGNNYLAYHPISNDTTIQFGDVAREYMLELDMYSRFAVAGDEEGKKTITLRVIPNIIVRGCGNALPAQHDVDLSNYLDIRRGYVDDEVLPLTFGEDGILSYSTEFSIFSDGSTLRYQDHVFDTTTKTLTLTYNKGAAYKVDLTITPDVNFNFKDNNVFYGSTSSTSYALSRKDWTQDGKGYTDYFGETISAGESFSETITFLEGSEDDGVTIDKTNHEVKVGAVNRNVQLKVTVTYQVSNTDGILGSVTRYTVLSISPNIKEVINTQQTIDVYAGNSLEITLNNNKIMVADKELFTINTYDKGVIENKITPSILFDIEEESKTDTYQGLSNYVFLSNGNKLCFRHVNDKITFNIPFRLNLRKDGVTYENAYQDTRLYITITLYPSVESLGLTSSVASSTTKENAFDLLGIFSTNKITLDQVITLNGVSGANDLTINYLYANFDVQVRDNHVWKIVDTTLVPVDASLLGDKIFVSYDSMTGTLTFAPCSTPITIGVTIILGGTKEIEVFVKLTNVVVEQANAIVSQEELEIDSEERKVKIVKQINEEEGTGNRFTYKIETFNNYEWTSGDKFTFQITDLLSYSNRDYSNEAFAISATSTSDWLTYNLASKMLELQVPNNTGENTALTPDSGVVQCIIAVGLDEYYFTIQF